MARQQVRLSQDNFTTGVIDPKLHSRFSWQLYHNAVQQLDNFIIHPHGCIEKRPGTRFVAQAKNTTANRLVKFIFSRSQAYVLEFGNHYIRFFNNSEQLFSGLYPLEVATPYSSTEVSDLHFTQSGDTLIITHPNYPPRELLRLEETTWVLRTFAFIPPTEEDTEYHPNANISLSNNIGDITVTATASVFDYRNIDSLILENASLGSGVAIITTTASATVATATIIHQFTNTSLGVGQWRIFGSPNAAIKVDKSQPVGAYVTITATYKPKGIDEEPTVIGATELVTNGDFDGSLSGWTDLSGPVLIATGAVTHEGSTADEKDIGFRSLNAYFRTYGVKPNMRVICTDDDTEDTIVSVDSEEALTTTTGGKSWSLGDNYKVQETGQALYIAGKAQLNGGDAGKAWLQQAITVEDERTYRLLFDVGTQPVSMFIGTTATGSEILAEKSYNISNKNEVLFKADGTTIYLNFRNNQSQDATLDNVSLKLFELPGTFLSADVGKFIRVNKGLIEITSVPTSSQAKGVIRKELSDTLRSLPGGWFLETSEWSGTKGYPRTLTFFGGRLYFAGSASYPMKVWGSKVGDFHNFATGVDDADALEFQISATEINPLVWLTGEQTLLAASEREEYEIQGSVANTITPTSIDVRSPSKIGSNSIQPTRTQRAVLYIQAGDRRLRELVYDINSNAKISNDLSIFAEFITSAGIRNIQHQLEPTSIIWVVTLDNQLASCTYLKDQQVSGWSQHPFGGDVQVMDICIIPHPYGDRDQVWLMLDRDGTLCIEYLEDFSGYYGRYQLDGCVAGTFDPPTTTVSGLRHLEGREVIALVDGDQQLPKTVSDGEIELDTAGTNVEVGIAFTSTVKTLRPELGAKPYGQELLGQTLGMIRLAVYVKDTRNLLINGERINFSTINANLDEPEALFTGFIRTDSYGTDSDQYITVVQDMAYPVTLMSINRTLIVEEAF